MVNAIRASGTGVIKGNRRATITHAWIILLRSLVVLATIISSAHSKMRRTEPALAVVGKLYSLGIGFAFKLVKIALLQRLSVFLGHPVYGLAVGLFGIILATGFGAFFVGSLSPRAPAPTSRLGSRARPCPLRSSPVVRACRLSNREPFASGPRRPFAARDLRLQWNDRLKQNQRCNNQKIKESTTLIKSEVMSGK